MAESTGPPTASEVAALAAQLAELSGRMLRFEPVTQAELDAFKAEVTETVADVKRLVVEDVERTAARLDELDHHDQQVAGNQPPARQRRHLRPVETGQRLADSLDKGHVAVTGRRRVDQAATAYRQARTDAFYTSTLRLRWARRRIAQHSGDIATQARLAAINDELAARDGRPSW